MSTFFTSDHHFFHDNIRTFCARPFASTEEMNERMVERWNEEVGADDEVYHLGDFGLAWVDRLKAIFLRLNGRKIGIVGNHDGTVSRLRRVGFDRVEKSIVLDDGTVLVHDRLTLDGYVVSEGPGTDTILSFPMHPRVLCGHVHQWWRRNGNCYNVGVDVWDFRPVTMSQIMEAEHG